LRAVAQRVSSATIQVGDEATGTIGPGLLALVGVGREDGPEDAILLAEKLVRLRVFLDADGKMNLSLLDVAGSLGVVSQFTLLGDCRKGRRPSYGTAAAPEQAEPLIELLVERARALGVQVATGRFRAKMEVTLVNDGPVTLLLDTKRVF
jgi:D-tyrosyl-tRNA(Tyr) deacylase